MPFSVKQKHPLPDGKECIKGNPYGLTYKSSNDARIYLIRHLKGVVLEGD